MIRLIVLPHLLTFIFLALLACDSSQAPTALTPSPEDNTQSPTITRKKPKAKDPAKMESCSKIGNKPCEGDKKCMDICDDVFSTRSDKKECYRFSETLVSGFEDLLEFAEEGDFDEMDPKILECMLDIDEREFAKALKKISRSEAEEFLEIIANDEILAEVLHEEDDEFNIIKQLLNRAAKSNNLISQLKQEIEDDKSFIYLAASSSESIWKWMDSYVDDVCSKSSSSNTCPGGEPIGAYCKTLLEFKKRDLEDFVSDTDFFAEEYEEEIDDMDYLYEVEDNPDDSYRGDFRDYCRVQVASQQPCPNLENNDYPLAAKKLADLTLANATYNSNIKAYVINGGYCHYRPGGNHVLRDATGTGTISPSNQLLLHISAYPELHLNDNILRYNADTTYYLYVKKDETYTRYDIGEPNTPTEPYTDNCTGSPIEGAKIRRWDGSGDLINTMFGDGTGTFSIWLAGEKDGRCSYYTSTSD